MKNIFRIFKSDLKGLGTHLFALIVAIGLCALPALYAWFNIYASWDPYENTGNVRLAAAIEDAGWTDDDGNYRNLGDEIKEDLAESDSINWVFEDSDEAVQEGVRSGEYYAAISIGKDFSKDMFADFGSKTSLPELNYYLNDKKNAVAAKITDTVVGNLQNSINEKYISITAKKLFGDLQDNAPLSEERTEVSRFTEKLGLIRDNLNDYNSMIDSLIKSNKMLDGVLDKTSEKLEASGQAFADGSAKLSSGTDNIEAAKASFNDFSANLTGTLSEIQGWLNALADGISSAQLEADAEALKARIEEMFPIITELREKLDILLDAFMEIDPDKIPFEFISDQIRDLQNIISVLETDATKTAAIDAAESLADSIHSSLESMAASVGTAQDMLTNQLVPSVNQMLDGLSDSMASLSEMLSNLSTASANLSGALRQLKSTSDTLDSGMSDLKDVISSASGSVADLIDKVNNAAYSDQLQMIIDFLSGDSSALGNYFADPVIIKDHYIYEIENYGSGMTPFYTALAIWVGTTILVTVLKVHPEKSDFPGAKRRERFLGRYLLFLLMSEGQTAIIVAGELCLFKIQCLDVPLFILASAIASLTISLIVYSLTVSFGDIGKAIAIAALVIQIAGSGGTYPIEILPDFFRNIYTLFPFPYAIDAMRECIGGMYDGTYLRCLLTLGIFCAAALFLGLLIRIPFISVNRYVEKRLEDTELM